MNPIKKVMSWWRGPTDQESLAEMDEAKRMAVSRDTIRVSQDRGMPFNASLIAAPTPDVLDPGSKDSDTTDSR